MSVLQQNKVNELYGIEGDRENILPNLLKTMELLQIRRCGAFFNKVKRCGWQISDILFLLLLLPFYSVKNISSLTNKTLEVDLKTDACKDVFYDLKNNELINWRSLLWMINLRINKLTGKLGAGISHKTRVFICDDSTLGKTGIKTEFISRVHDHVTNRFIFGYKLLVLGYWDGDSFVALDFSLHREKGQQQDKAQKRLAKAVARQNKCSAQKFNAQERLKKTAHELKSAQKANNKQAAKGSRRVAGLIARYEKTKEKVAQKEKAYQEATNLVREQESELARVTKRRPDYGLSPEKTEAQYSKERKPGTPGNERAIEIDSSKIQGLIKMLRQAVRRGIEADYVLTDSWFCCFDLIKEVTAIGKKTGLQLLTMAKMGTGKYELLPDGGFYDAKTLLAKYERQATAARSHKARYFKVKVRYNGLRVNLFFVKINGSNSWRLLLTTDLNMGFNKLMETYQLRWSIEVFFREAKQYLNLGGCRSTCFDSQIAETTISLIQYNMLSFHKKTHEFPTFDGVFAQLRHEVKQYNLGQKIQAVFWLIVETFGQFAGVDTFDFIEGIFRDENIKQKFEILNLDLQRYLDVY